MQKERKRSLNHTFVTFTSRHSFMMSFLTETVKVFLALCTFFLLVISLAGPPFPLHISRETAKKISLKFHVLMGRVWGAVQHVVDHECLSPFMVGDGR